MPHHPDRERPADPPPIRVPLSDIAVDDELRAVVDATVASGWWSMGPRAAAFEADFAHMCGVRHAFVVSSGTAALHLALLACGIGPGDEVILPSLTFVAAANMVRAVGATPVLCDIAGPDDLNLDPDDVARAVTPATRAILPVHYGGTPCDMGAIMRIAAEHGLVVIEDAAHAPGAALDGRAAGAIGAAGCFSFFANKNLPIGEGGMVVTDDDTIAERIRLYRSHGMTTLTWDRHRGHASGYDVLAHGYNYRLDELHAAIGHLQLGRLAEGNARRGVHAARYREALAGIPGLGLPFADDARDVVDAHHLMVVLLPDGTDRNSLRDHLAAAGVQSSVHYPPIHTFAAFAGEAARRPLAKTDAVAGRLLTLPLYPHLTDEQRDLVVSALTAAVDACR